MAHTVKDIQFSKRHYLIDGEPGFLYSGEFHYFRVPRKAWRERLRLFRDAGGNCIATYVPWLIHEPEEGRFIFDGADHLCFEAFLDAAAAEGLPVIARPGPYQYSELVYGGLPRWLLDNYPALHGRRLNGEDIEVDCVSYLHPLFLEKVAHWFDVVCPIIARYTASHGGPVAFCQFDNELMGMQLWRGSPDYNSETMGFGQPEGRFTKFLKSRYRLLDALNSAYDAAYSCYEDVRPLPPAAMPRPSDFRRKKDYLEFYFGTIGEYSRLMAGMMRERGIYTPMVHNSANPDMNAFFLETVEAMGEGFILGSDHYYNLGQDWNQNNPTPQYALNVFYSNEILRLMGFPPTIFELPGGSCSDWPPIMPSDLRACILLNVALGMRGANFYIFTGGPNPPGVGLNTDIYDYGAPVGAEGEIRPHYYVIKETGEFLADNAWMTEAERVIDVRVGLDYDQARARIYEMPLDNLRIQGKQAWEITRTGVLTTAFCASVSPGFVDLAKQDWMDDFSTPLIVVTADSMSARKQQNIIDFIRKGGKVLLLPVIPRFDENLTPCTLLADFLGAGAVIINGRRQVRFNCGPIKNIFDNGGVFFSTPPSGGVTLGVDEFSSRSIAWKVAWPDGGSAIYLGFCWVHAKNEHSQMLTWLLGELGGEQQIICSNPNVWTSLWRHEKRDMLFVMNLFSSKMEGSVRWQGTDGERIHTFALEPMSVIAVEVNPPDMELHPYLL